MYSIFKGYPRFKIHALVEKLMEICLKRRARRSGLSEYDFRCAGAVIPPGHTAFSWNGDISLPPSSSSPHNPCGHTSFSWTSNETLNNACMVFPSFSAAKRFSAFMGLPDVDGKNYTNRVEIEPLLNTPIYVAYFPSSLSCKSKAFWQHCGEIVSSRLAEYCLQRLCNCGSMCLTISVTKPYTPEGTRRCRSDEVCRLIYDESSSSAFQPLTHRTPSFVDLEMRARVALDLLQSKISSMVSEPKENIILTVSGMSAIYSAYRLMRFVKGYEYPVVVFGFPYLDTLKLTQRSELNPAGCHFFGYGSNEDMNKLEAMLDNGLKIAGLFTEFPSNPLLRCHDMVKLTHLAKKHDFLFIVDDTVSGFASLDLLHGGKGVSADMLCTSLTKCFSGRGDVLGGSIIINSNSKYSATLKSMAHSEDADFPTLHATDAETLVNNSEDYEGRCRKINENTFKMAQWFKDQPEFSQVYYPGTACSESKNNYEKCMKHDSGVDYGCLISIVVSEDIDPIKFFDELKLHKGPSLGTNYTLVCPYTLLAHYNELEWAASFGVDRNIIRISIGLETHDMLVEKFTEALNAARGKSILSTDGNIDENDREDEVSKTWGDVADKPLRREEDEMGPASTSTSTPVSTTATTSTPPRKTSNKIPSSPGLPYPECFSKAEDSGPSYDKGATTGNKKSDTNCSIS